MHNQEEGGLEVDDGFGNKYFILETYSRSERYYTQGLYYYKGRILESTGLYGHSTMQWLSLDQETKQVKIDKQVRLNSGSFGEGCDVLTINGKERIF